MKAVKLQWLGTESGKTGCPTLYSTDRRTYVVQGWRVTDPDLLSRFPVTGQQAVVEIPAALMNHRHNVPADRSTSTHEVTTMVCTASKSTLVVMGHKIDDSSILDQLEVPDHETVVEVPAAQLDWFPTDP